MSSLIFVFMMLCAASMAYVHSPACGANEKYSVCEKNCEPICPATEKKICFTTCMPRCVCIEGYSRTERNGVCVPKDDCFKYFQFPEFQDYLNSEENNDDSIIPEPIKDNSASSMSGNDDLPSIETVDDDSTTSESASDDFTTIESVNDDYTTVTSVNNDFTTITSVNDDVSTTSESVSDDFSTTESVNNDFTTLTSANDDVALPENE